MTPPTVIRCRGNVVNEFLPNKRIHVIEPLPNNDRRDTQTHRLMGRIYK
jgi:hypothetical protein